MYTLLSARNHMLLTSGIHARISQIKVVRLIIRISIEFAHEFQKSFFPQSVLQIFSDRQREQIWFIQDQGDVRPPKFFENTWKNELQSALAVRHPCQSWIFALIVENSLFSKKTLHLYRFFTTETLVKKSIRIYRWLVFPLVKSSQYSGRHRKFSLWWGL